MQSFEHKKRCCREIVGVYFQTYIYLIEVKIDLAPRHNFRVNNKSC